MKKFYLTNKTGDIEKLINVYTKMALVHTEKVELAKGALPFFSLFFLKKFYSLYGSFQPNQKVSRLVVIIRLLLIILVHSHTLLLCKYWMN